MISPTDLANRREAMKLRALCVTARDAHIDAIARIDRDWPPEEGTPPMTANKPSDPIMNAAWALIWWRIGELSQDEALAIVDIVSEASCWFIEEKEQSAIGYRWWSGHHGWDVDPDRAVRFKRKEDADAVIWLMKWDHTHATSHSFSVEIVR